MTDLDAPLRLSIAAREAFPDGTMTASGLRKEAGKGHLVIERIAGKDYTTLGEIKKMRELCRVEVKEQGSTSNRPDQLETESPPNRQFGASGTVPSSAAQKQARAKLQKLKNHSPPTSTQKPHRGSATVTPLRSSLRT